MSDSDTDAAPVADLAVERNVMNRRGYFGPARQSVRLLQQNAAKNRWSMLHFLNFSLLTFD